MDGFYTGTSPMTAVINRLRMGGPDMDNHLKLMDEIDWAKTSLGPMDTWPQELASQFFITMLLPNAQSLVFGPDQVVIYNIEYGKMIRDHHPSYFGRPVSTWTDWAPYFEKMASIYGKATTSGRAYIDDDFSMFMKHHGVPEEVHFQCAVLCLPPPLQGFLGNFFETSATVFHDKRSLILQELLASWKTATSLDSLWDIALRSFSRYPKLFPFVALYTGALPSETGNSSDSSGNDSEDFVYSLGGVAGDVGHEPIDAPQHFDLGSVTGSFTRHFQAARLARAPVLVDGSEIPEGWQQVAQSRGFGDACRGAVVCPSSSNGLSKVQAFLVLGLSTRNPYDASYQEWVSKLQREFADVVASIISAHEAARKKRESARRVRVEKELLNKEIALRKREAELAAVRVEKIAKIAGLADVGIFEHDLDGQITFANDAYYRITGNPPGGEFDGEATRLCLPPAHWNALLRGEARNYETKFKNGSWGLCSSLPSRDENGEIDAVIGVVTNIESQKRAEQEAVAKVEALERVRAGERRFYRFLEIVPAGILIVNTDRRATFATDEWHKLTGCKPCPPDEIDWVKCILEEDHHILDESWRTLTVESRPVNFQVRVHRQWINSAGQPCGNAWVTCKALPEFNEDGLIQQVVSTITDISHLKFAETVQRTRVAEAVEAKRQQENFVDMTSHEIRNPLSAVIHCADSVWESLTDMHKLISEWKAALQRREPIPTADIKRFADMIESGLDAVDTISSCSAHQKRIVDDILTLSKLDANLLRIAPSLVRTSSILEDTQKMFEVEGERVGVELKTFADRSIRDLDADWVVIDPGRVMQVLINLVTNAIKFTKAATKREVTVRMGASVKRPLELPVDFTLARSLQDSIFDTAEFAENTCYLWFTVADTGAGMTPDEKNRIFSRFVQGSVRTYNTYGGSGLGLFISRTLVEIQGGEIGAASESGKGSMFAFFVRTHTSPPLETESPTSIPRSQGPSPMTAAAIARNSENPVNVLIVEDNAVNQRVMEKQLTKKGYITYVANNGQEALDFIKTTKLWKGNVASTADIDVILMDVEMPVMDGLACAKHIREYQRSGDICTANLPIIAASANARQEQVNMAISAGMDDSITKPFRIPDLTPKIDSYAAWARSKRK